MDFFNNLLALCKKNGTSPSAVAREIGLNNSSATYWKRGSIPKSDTLQKLAEHFNVSVDSLLGVKPLPEKEVELHFGSENEKVVMSGEALELEVFDKFLGDIGFQTYINPEALNQKSEKEWIIEDIRENKCYLATSNDLNRLKDTILAFFKFQVYELLNQLEPLPPEQEPGLKK